MRKFLCVQPERGRNSGREPTIYPACGSMGWDVQFGTWRRNAEFGWASQEFSTDWGTRDLSPSVSFIRPHQLSPGKRVGRYSRDWVSLSEYRKWSRPVSGYAHLMQNADLTWVQDLGAVTELLSGEFFQWFGRSTSHQLWSSAMVVTPRGVGCSDWNGKQKRNTLTVTPSLPAEWTRRRFLACRLENPVWESSYDGMGRRLPCASRATDQKAIHLGSRAAGAKVENGELRIPLRAVEVGLAHGLPDRGGCYCADEGSRSESVCAFVCSCVWRHRRTANKVCSFA